MKKFIKTLLLFFVPILLLLYPIDVFISKNLKKSNAIFGEYEVWNDIYNSKIKADVLIYGSSRAWVDISPKILEDSLQLEVYNFGMDGHNFWLQYLRHVEYLKHNNPPKQIILAVDINSLQKRDNLYLHEQFLPYMLWNKNIKEFTETYEGFNYFDYDIPLIRYAGNSSIVKNAITMGVKNENNTPYRTKGYKGINKTWSNDLEIAKSKMKNYKIKLDTASVVLFDKFLQECKNNNIKVSLIYTPEHIEGQKFIKNKNLITDLYKKHAEKYNLLYLDYSKDSICLDKSYFYNATHLNKTGSEVFSKKLVNDLLSQQIID
ncbi:hypothetical protein ABXT64_08890 [Candidatus Marifrigoribacter sp. Uisw_064]|jgi:hypothetical protein|uniref:hypothetical protein n=1 Tax=Candidatus Marifrigoribacter sp. Uisw_064 TaxID=3230970 RepID=UPI003ADD903B